MTPPTTTDAHVVEGSEGLLLEIDGRIVPNYDATMVLFEEGDVVTGRVVRIDKDEVLVDIGYKSEGVIPSNELSIRKSVNPNEEVEIGEEVDALVLTKEDQDGRLILSKKRARFERAWRRIEAAAESGEPVHGSVIEVVKGGLIVDLGVRGFLPASLVDIRRVPNLDEYLGQTIESKVIELNRPRNNVVLSRRAVLEEERKEQRQAILERLQPGLVIEGQISNIVEFGAFVDLDGIDGLIHISELSWSHVNHPSEILNIGDTVQVKVLDIDRDRQRISLGLKQTQEDPWQRVVDTYSVGDELEGKRHEGRRVRRVRRDPRGRRGPRAHLGARPAARREPARDRAARRRGAREDPRDRLRAPPPVAVDQARRGPDPAAPHAAGGRGRARERGRPRQRARAGPVRGRLRGAARGRGRRGARGSRPRTRPRSRPRRPQRPRAEAPAEAEAEPSPAEAEAAPEAAAEQARPRTRSRRSRTAVRRPDGRHRGGQVGGARRARAAGRRDAVDRRGRARAVRRPRGARRGRRALGAGRRAGRRPSTAPRSRATRSPRPTSAPGSRACCGRASARASPPGARPRARARRRRARSSSRRRCCSRPGWSSSTTLRLSWSRTSAIRAERAAAGDTPRSTSAPRASSPRRRRRRARITLSAMTGISMRWSRNWRAFLRS